MGSRNSDLSFVLIVPRHKTSARSAAMGCGCVASCSTQPDNSNQCTILVSQGVARTLRGSGYVLSKAPVGCGLSDLQWFSLAQQIESTFPDAGTLGPLSSDPHQAAGFSLALKFKVLHPHVTFEYSSFWDAPGKSVRVDARVPKQWCHAVRIAWETSELPCHKSRKQANEDPRKVASYTTNDGDTVKFAIECRKLVKYVNGQKQVGAAPNDGIVSMLTINTAAPYDVRDQYGSGSSDYPEKVVSWLRDVAPAVDVPVVGNVWWAAPAPAPEVSHEILGNVWWATPVRMPEVDPIKEAELQSEGSTMVSDVSVWSHNDTQ